VRRRGVLGLGVAAVAAGLAGCSDPKTAVLTSPSGVPSGTGLPALTPTPSASGTSLPSYGPKLITTLKRFLQPSPENPKHPSYAGAVVHVSVNGVTQMQAAVGDALRYGAGPVELAPAKRVAMRTDSIFDLASITKVYTAILALQLVDKGQLDLDAPVVNYLPEFAGPGKDAVTIAMLLAHTSALPVGAKVTGLPDAAARWSAVVTTPLVSGQAPGTLFRYSSVGLMVLGRIVEKLTGQSLDHALASGLTGPLGLRETGFKPMTWLSSAERAARMVATDARTSRGLLRGVVHDDVANILGGVAGHAGIFSTAKDLAVIGQMLLDGGVYRGKRILGEATVRRMLTNANPGLPATDPDRPHRTSTHGLGVELDQTWFMGRLSSPTTFGHTGFTGTSILVDQSRKLVLVLLTNRAHPNWSWANPDPVRAAVANVIADARP
jgi:CubicO group peptidase (beta-lactamase class C family)